MVTVFLISPVTVHVQSPAKTDTDGFACNTFQRGKWNIKYGYKFQVEYLKTYDIKTAFVLYTVKS